MTRRHDLIHIAIKFDQYIPYCYLVNKNCLRLMDGQPDNAITYKYIWFFFQNGPIKFAVKNNYLNMK